MGVRKCSAHVRAQGLKSERTKCAGERASAQVWCADVRMCSTHTHTLVFLNVGSHCKCTVELVWHHQWHQPIMLTCCNVYMLGPYVTSYYDVASAQQDFSMLGGCEDACAQQLRDVRVVQNRRRIQGWPCWAVRVRSTSFWQFVHTHCASDPLDDFGWQCQTQADRWGGPRMTTVDYRL